MKSSWMFLAAATYVLAVLSVSPFDKGRMIERELSAIRRNESYE